MADRGTWKIAIGGVPFADYTSILEPSLSDGMPIIQKDSIYGAANSANRAKGNFELQIAFSLLIEQANNADSATLFLLGPQAVNGVKTVDLYHRDYGGSESHWTITGTEVHFKPDPPKGVTNTGTITFTGGVIAVV